MVKLELVGFNIYENPLHTVDRTYIVPIYSCMCDCNLEKYLSVDCYLTNQFRMYKIEYLKKYLWLQHHKKLGYKEIRGSIPYDELTNPCICPSRKFISGSANIFMKNIAMQRNAIGDPFIKDIFSALKDEQYFFNGYWLSRWIVDGWANYHYGWYRLQGPDLNMKFSECQELNASYPEMKLLALMKPYRDEFKKEIYDALDETIEITDLIDIIHTYSYTPVHVMGNIIDQLMKNNVKYGQLMEEMKREIKIGD
ncbi:MAG: hypothetical protein Hyperionvirus1_100 [Hyperionvirus sp.]|uniref:Uncharacterized protein n=1 Tax=Hyperionvirus sp. TaxID=2487770 RepID=A0A3G5A8L4_9VIRU|nr:MAG: hypothetical protein Hyperionvirus1_100 [Hyperionvirus sp.]